MQCYLMPAAADDLYTKRTPRASIAGLVSPGVLLAQAQLSEGVIYGRSQARRAKEDGEPCNKCSTPAQGTILR